MPCSPLGLALWTNSYCGCSDFRQVPDTQEVFTTEDGDVSVVVEVLDVVKDEGSEDDLWKAVK